MTSFNEGAMQERTGGSYVVCLDISRTDSYVSYVG